MGDRQLDPGDYDAIFLIHQVWLIWIASSNLQLFFLRFCLIQCHVDFSTAFALFAFFVLFMQPGRYRYIARQPRPTSDRALEKQQTLSIITGWERRGITLECCLILCSVKEGLTLNLHRFG